MADPKDSVEISKALQGVLVEVKNAARTMSAASEKLSTTGIDKLTSELTKSLKNRKLLNSAEADAIKDNKKLAETLDVLEKQFAAIQKIEEEEEKAKIKSLKNVGSVTKGQIENQKRIEKASKDNIAARLAELNITAEHSAILKEQLPLLRAEAEARAKAISSVDGLNKIHDDLRKTIADQIKGFFTFRNALDHVTKAVSLTYEQMNRLSGQGMIGAFNTLQMLSPKLMLSAKDLEEVISKNRDIVNQMGGGTKGIQEFSSEIYATKDALEYLGKDWAKAGVSFIEASKKAGLTPKDGAAYQKNMKQSIASFKDFSSMFGDTPEQFKALQEGMIDDENIRQRLNGLNKTQLGQELEEQRQRAFNLKLMGLSNDEIVDFTKKLSSAIDPRKAGTIGERQKNALGMQQTHALLVNQLANGTAEQQALGKILSENAGGMNAISSAIGTGNPADLVKAMSDNPVYARAFADAMTQNNQGDLYQGELIKQVAEQMGVFRDKVLDVGQTLSNKKAGGQDITAGRTDEQIAAIKKKNLDDLLAENALKTKAFIVEAAAYERIRLLMDGPYGEAIQAATAALGALTLAGGMNGLLGVFKRLIGAGGGSAAAGAAGGAAAGAAGGAAASGGIRAKLAAGAKFLKGGTGLGLLLHTGEAGHTQEEENAILAQKRSQGFVPYNGANAPGTGGAGGGKGSVVPPGVSSGATSSSAPAVADGKSANATALGNLIAGGEAGKAGYNANNKGTSQGKIIAGDNINLGGMSIGDIMKRQALPSGDPNRLFAVGKYQMIPSTFKEIVNGLKLDRGTMFTPDVQEQMFQYIITKKRPKIGDYLSGKSNDLKGAQLAMAQEWRSVADPNTGMAYNGDGKGSVNKASISSTQVASTLNSMRGGTALIPPNTDTATLATTTTNQGAQGAQSGTPALSAAEIELKNQTAILVTIAQNTANRNSTPVNPNAYKQDAALVTSGIAG